MRRVVVFIIIFAVFICFIVLNLDEEHRCNISFGFYTLENIPIFLSSLTSFTLGMLVTIPMHLGRKKKKEKPEKIKSPKKGELSPPDDELKIEKSPYGID